MLKVLINIHIQYINALLLMLSILDYYFRLINIKLDCRQFITVRVIRYRKELFSIMCLTHIKILVCKKKYSKAKESYI